MRVFLLGLALLFSLTSVGAGTAPTVAKAPFQASQNDLGCAQNLTSELAIETCIIYVFGPDYKIALAVARAESRLNPQAVGYNRDASGAVWSRDCSIFQVNSYYHPGACAMTTLENIQYAHRLYLKGGWAQWAAYNNGSYLRYLR